ncbi:MAG: outer spore coat protein CotE [Bacilli bacterium]|nr:outer spore coat protein CotE [Bacilli bacterium]
MAYFKEIVTKAIIGKGKKTSNLEHIVQTEDNINTVLGCWVINHIFDGINNNGKVNVNGSYDINIWYSYDNNTKTNVLVRRFNYQDIMNVKIKENSEVDNTSEIIVRALNQPSVTDVNVEGSEIKLTVHKELGVEVVGDTKVRVSVEDEFEDYEEILDEDEINEALETEVSDDYLN